MATKSKKGNTSQEEKTVSKNNSTLSQEEIERQAYMLWLEKGGDQLDNWLEAERRIR